MNNMTDGPTGDNAELMRLLELGLGRAVLFLRDKDATQYRKIITYACVQNLVYDAQCENNRAQFMYDVIQATDEPEYYAPYICEALRATTAERELDQLFELALLLAQQGNQEARGSLYDAFDALPNTEGTKMGATEIVKLDSINGLIHVVHNTPQRDPDDDYYGYVATDYVEILDKQMGKEACRAALKELSTTDPAVASVLAEVEWFEETRDERQRRPSAYPLPPFEKFRELLSAKDRNLYRLRWRNWGKEASEEFVRRASGDLLEENDPLRLLRLLHFFEQRAFPDEPDVLLRLTENEDDDIARAASRALRNVRHSKVRDLAIVLLSESDSPRDGLDMLSSNYQNGDDGLVIAALTRNLLAHEFHWLGISVREFYRTHPSPTAKEALMILYERDRCTRCRESAVEMLMGLGPLPEWIIQECRYDANIHLRELVQS